MHHLGSVAFMRLNDRVGLRSMVIPEVPPRVNLLATKYDRPPMVPVLNFQAPAGFARGLRRLPHLSNVAFNVLYAARGFSAMLIVGVPPIARLSVIMSPNT